jgi:hypothetical protein
MAKKDENKNKMFAYYYTDDICDLLLLESQTLAGAKEEIRGLFREGTLDVDTNITLCEVKPLNTVGFDIIIEEVKEVKEGKN